MEKPSIDGRLVTFAYALGETVGIRGMGVEGRVLARCEKPGDQHSYNVTWWQESKRNDEWLQEFELESIG